jgi:hypothetical protein
MISPIPKVSFQIALCREIGFRLSNLVSREPATAFLAMPAQELLPRVLSLKSNSRPQSG